MATDKLDSSKWYQIYVGDTKQSLVGTSSTATGPVYFNYTDTSDPNQKWQVFQLNSTTWTIRNSECGPDKWMGTVIADTEETQGKTRPRMARGDIADSSAFWTINPWGDGTYYLTNYANGTGYHLQRKENALLVMSPNTTAPQNMQRFQFKAVGPIEKPGFSSVNLLGAVVATSTAPSSSATATPSSTTSQTSNTNSSSGLSPGAQAAIGASVGAVALIALVVLGLLFWRKRKVRQAQPHAELPAQDVSHELTQSPMTKYAMLQGTPRHEVAYTGIFEAPSNERPVELPGDNVRV